MQSKEDKNLVFIRLFQDEDFYESLRAACVKHVVKTAVFLSGIGQLKDFKLGYFVEKGNYGEKHFPEVHELIALQGNVVFQDEEYVFHVHCVVGNREKKAFGGHLLSGKVSITNEIVLLKTDIEAARRIGEETGLYELFLE
ncbi:MAG: DUF296 domain-containing protein [Methanobacteriota archaeon]